MENQIKQILLRLPFDLKQWITHEANKDCRSVNMQVVYFLTQIKNSNQGNELNGSTTK